MLTIEVKAFDEGVPETYPTREGACVALITVPGHNPDEAPYLKNGHVWRRVIWETDGETGKFHLITRTPPHLYGYQVLAYIELPDPEEYPWPEPGVLPVLPDYIPAPPPPPDEAAAEFIPAFPRFR